MKSNGFVGRYIRWALGNRGIRGSEMCATVMEYFLTNAEYNAETDALIVDCHKSDDEIECFFSNFESISGEVVEKGRSYWNYVDSCISLLKEKNFLYRMLIEKDGEVEEVYRIEPMYFGKYEWSEVTGVNISTDFKENQGYQETKITIYTRDGKTQTIGILT